MYLNAERAVFEVLQRSQVPTGGDTLMNAFASGKPYQTSVTDETFIKHIK